MSTPKNFNPMDAGEKREILEFLHAGRNALREALAGVDNQMAAQHPDAGGWSIRECVEHVAVAERALLERLLAAQPAERSLENRPREARFLERAINRSRPIVAPPLSHPADRFLTLRAAMAAFEKSRVQVVTYVEEFEDDLRWWATDHPMIEGPVNCYELLLMIGAHPGRHAKQIVEIRKMLEGSRW